VLEDVDDVAVGSADKESAYTPGFCREGTDDLVPSMLSFPVRRFDVIDLNGNGGDLGRCRVFGDQLHECPRCRARCSAQPIPY
jgi:hypothetical protein